MRVAFVALTALIAAPALAAPAPNWTVDKTQSHINFTASMSGQAINGGFRRFEARILFDPANLAGSRVVAVIDTGSATTGDATRDESLPNADWFNVTAFPRATFQSTGFKSLGGAHYLATGTLTIRGVRRAIALPFQLVTQGNQARMSGSLTIDRRWFGVGQGQFASPDTVAANVRIDISILARK